ncbi:hypothetical protein PRIPAC_86005 [Pristionchus pacificus]|uniref:Uncharacterized protein n=1 Tax=Pristionchus pacificus TaxID=54126 RepID=A0A2A6BUI7_PRIPA|nr:hypothetical protein PRIPAC_86005 [Pristionchus pacificus]|eukprot:PDM69421.1 hypothetical protein PRIPAC_44517 [Pristionchus pacificus]
MVKAYQERYLDEWNSGTPDRGNASDYVKSQSLKQFTICSPPEGRKWTVLAYAKNKFHNKEDGKIFQKYQENSGLFIITTSSVYFGCDYVVRVIDREKKKAMGDLLQIVEFEVRSKRSYDEQQKLIYTIRNNIDERSMVVGELFRDIDLSDHPELNETDGTITGILKPKQRSKSGHPFNIGFDRVPVLHMSTYVSNTQDSWYASTRVFIPPECIFDEEMALFLTGMHCYGTNGAHYVDLMLAKSGSSVCKDLINDGARELDISDNPFFTYNSETKKIKCASKMNLLEGQDVASTLVVEIALAEKEVHLENARVQKVDFIERNNRFPNANTDCTLCFPEKETIGSISF